MLMDNVTASAAPVPTAAVTSSKRPDAAPAKRESVKKVTQITESIVLTPFGKETTPFRELRFGLMLAKGMN